MKSNILGAVCLSLAAGIWGSMYVVSKYVLDYVPPFTLLWLRYAIAGLLLFIIMFAVRQDKIKRQDLLLFVWIGFIGYFISVGTQFLGTKLADAHTGSLLTASSPVFTFLLARLLLNEAITGRKLLALGLSIIGIITVIGFSPTVGGSWTGNLYLVIAAITWALLSVYVKKASTAYSSLTITSYAILFALLFTTPAAVWELQSQPFGLLANHLVWLGTLYIGIVSTAAAFFLWNKGMDLMEAGAGSLFFCFQPIVGALLGWTMLNEKLDARFYIGAALIIGSLIVVSTEKEKST